MPVDRSVLRAPWWRSIWFPVVASVPEASVLVNNMSRLWVGQIVLNRINPPCILECWEVTMVARHVFFLSVFSLLLR
jgi:hypothetical protein